MKVKFVPQNVEYEIKPGEPVMHVAQDHGIYIKSVCKGVPNCAECRVRVVDGEHNVLPPGTEELSLIGSGYFIDRRRLSCQLKCFGDIVVDMTEQIQKEQGLLGGRKSKKMQVKDDRVEAVVARRSEDSPEGAESGDAEMAEAATEAPAPQRERQPQQQHSRPQGQHQQPRRDNRPPRPEGGDSRPPRPEGEGGGKRRRRRRGGKGRGGGGGGGGGAPPQG